MESVLRTMKKMTGKSEEELRNEMRQELEELEREVSALKELLKTKPTPKAKGGKKKAETEGEEQKDEKAEKEEKPKKAKAAPKKKAAAAVVEVHEPELMQELEREMPAAVTATEEDEEVEVEEIEYDGVKYLRSGKGIVYDMETNEEIGRWNEETKSIEVE